VAGWLPDEVTEKCRSAQSPRQQAISTAPSPFLDEHAIGLPSCHQTLSMGALSTGNIEVDAALGVMFNDALRPYTSDGDLLVFAPELHNNSNRPHFTNVSEEAVSSFLTRLEEASSSFYRALHDAPKYLTDPQIQFMAGQVEQLHTSMRAYQQQQPDAVDHHTADNSIGGKHVPEIDVVSLGFDDRAAPTIFCTQFSSSSGSHNESNALRSSAQTSSRSSLTNSSSDDECDQSMLKHVAHNVSHNCVQPSQMSTSQSSASLANTSTQREIRLGKQPFQHDPAQNDYISANCDQSDSTFSNYVETTSPEQAYNFGNLNPIAHDFQYHG
jgi:hypothetical protein